MGCAVKLQKKGFPWLRPLAPSLTPLDTSLIRTLQGHTESVTAVALTPDGRCVVSGSWDKTLRVWDLESGQTLRTLEGHARGVTAVALSPDGRHVISGSNDRTLRVWDLKDGKEFVTLTVDGKVKACAVARDNSTIVAGDSFGRPRVLLD